MRGNPVISSNTPIEPPNSNSSDAPSLNLFSLTPLAGGALVAGDLWDTAIGSNRNEKRRSQNDRRNSIVFNRASSGAGHLTTYAGLPRNEKRQRKRKENNDVTEGV
jgi:hypothetical protein